MIIIDFAKHFKSVKSFENDGIYTVEVIPPTVKHAESVIYPLRDKVLEPLASILGRDIRNDGETPTEVLLKLKDNPSEYSNDEVKQILDDTVLFMQELDRPAFNEVKKIIFSYCKNNFTVSGSDNDIIRYTKEQIKAIDNIEFGELEEIEEFSRDVIASFLGACVWKPLIQKIKHFKILNTKRTKKA